MSAILHLDLEAELDALRAELSAIKARVVVLPELIEKLRAIAIRERMFRIEETYTVPEISDSISLLNNEMDEVARLSAAPVQQQASVPDGWRELAKRADDFLYSLPETDGVLRLRADLCSMLAAPAAPAEVLI